jgi:hypothetical protein
VADSESARTAPAAALFVPGRTRPAFPDAPQRASWFLAKKMDGRGAPGNDAEADFERLKQPSGCAKRGAYGIGRLPRH